LEQLIVEQRDVVPQGLMAELFGIRSHGMAGTPSICLTSR